MRASILSLVVLLCVVTVGQAQIPQPSPTITEGASNTWNLDWEGIPGRTYFIQQSDDLANWQFFPTIEVGYGNTIPYGFTSTGEKCFVRLLYTDDTSTDSYWGDFDGDGINNWDEVNIFGTNPLNADTDGDGVPDGAEVGSGSDPDDSQSAPDFWWQRTTRDLQYDFDDYEPPNNKGTLVWNALWNTSLNSTEQLSAPIPFPDLKGRLQELTFPSTLSPTEGASGLAVSEGYSNLLPNPPCYHATLNHQRHWLRTGTTWPDQYKKTVIVLTERTLDGVEQTPEVDTEDVIIPANQLVSEPFDVVSGFVQNFTGNEYHSEEVTTTPFTVEIEPDYNQAGTTGELIPSNKGAVGEKHYVSPKKTAEIPDDFVVLKATGVEEDRFVVLLEWEGGEAHPTDPMKRRVKRDAAAKTVVKIKVKQGGAEAAKMNVWVVWSSPVVQKGNGEFEIGDGWSQYKIPLTEEDGWLFKFEINPAEVITAGDRPSLGGANRKAPPGAGNLHSLLVGQAADSASHKWDLSRQIQVTIHNPDLIAKDLLDQHDSDTLWVNQLLAAADTVIPFPQLPEEGNDDPPVADEHTNPYVESDILALRHAVGELACHDAPNIVFLDLWGQNNFSLTVDFQFREFARLELWDGKREQGKFWFRISDQYPWHFKAKAKFNQPPGDWVNDGSTTNIP